MRLCLYNGSKKKKSSSKKTKKNNSSQPNGKANVKNKKSKNASRETSKSKKTDRKKKEPVEPVLDPPSLCRLSLHKEKRESNGTAQGALEFWKFVDAYTSSVTKEDLNYLNHLTDKYSKENCPLVNILPSNYLPHGSSTDFPDNWVERIVGALVDPDLFPADEEEENFAFHPMTSEYNSIKHDYSSVKLDYNPMTHEEVDVKRLKLCESIDGGVFSERSNLLNLTSLCVDEEEEMMANCDSKPDQADCDEVSLEILACQEELKRVCRDNETTLSRLLARAQKEIESQTLSRNLSLCETELVKLTQQKHSRLKKETVTSSTRKVKDEQETLLQRRDLLLASLRDQAD